MAVRDFDHNSRQTRLHKVLARVLAVTRRGLAFFGLGAVLWVAHLLLPFLAGYFPPWGLMFPIMGVMLLGLWANVWNAQCDFVATVLCDGWVRAITQAMRFGVYGGYAREHCEELASYLGARKYRLMLFLLPHVWSLVAVVAFAILFITGGWPFE